MSTACIKCLIDHGDQLFVKRGGLLSLWQEVAELFYPERADFTTTRNIGRDLANNLMTSYPVIARRDLGNAFGAMLRPSQKEWFSLATNRPENEDTEAKQWLEWAGKLQRRAMYDRTSQMQRATKEADHDFSAFGQCVISTELNRERNGLLYRCWHLRDCAWVEDENGLVRTLHRKWKPTASDLVRLFPATVHEKVRAKLEKEPFAEFNVRHIIMPAEQYMALPGAKKIRQPFASVWIDVDHNHEMECVGSWTQVYTVARWQTVSGSQYAHSPAVVAALPDARLIQDVTRVLLEAGEKAVNPPMVAVKDAIRSDISIYAGGVTMVEADYDERLGEVLRPITQDKGGLSFGMDMAQDLRTQLADAFYLSKLNLPPVGAPGMTAYEVGQRVQEYIRNTLPLFEPMEMDYNGQLCDITFTTLLQASPEMRQSIPKSLRGTEVTFSFQSPLREAIEKIKVGQFLESQQVLAAALQLDPSTAHLVDGKKATRDVLEAVVPAKWLRTEAEVDELAAADAAQQQTAQLLQMMKGGADVAATLGKAAPAGQNV